MGGVAVQYFTQSAASPTNAFILPQSHHKVNNAYVFKILKKPKNHKTRK